MKKISINKILLAFLRREEGFFYAFFRLAGKNVLKPKKPHRPLQTGNCEEKVYG